MKEKQPKVYLDRTHGCVGCGFHIMLYLVATFIAVDVGTGFLIGSLVGISGPIGFVVYVVLLYLLALWYSRIEKGTVMREPLQFGGVVVVPTKSWAFAAIVMEVKKPLAGLLSITLEKENRKRMVCDVADGPPLHLKVGDVGMAYVQKSEHWKDILVVDFRRVLPE